MLKGITFKLVKGNVSLTIDTKKRKVMVEAKADEHFTFSSIGVFKTGSCEHIGTVYPDTNGKGEFEYSKEWDWLFKQDPTGIWKSIYLVTP